MVNCCRGNCYPPIRLWLLSLAPASVLVVGAFVARLLPLLPELWMRQSAFILLLSFATLFLLYAVPKAIIPIPTTCPSPSHRSPIASGSNNHKRHHRSKDGQSHGKGIGSDTYYELIAEEASHLARNPLN